MELNEREAAMVAMGLGFLSSYLSGMPEPDMQKLLANPEVKRLFDSRNELLAAVTTASRKPHG